LKDWERLFGRALGVLDAAQEAASHNIVWTLGGGSALMRRHRHRWSPGVDIFLRDERMLHCVSSIIEREPALDQVGEPAAFRIYLPEGHIAFIARAPVTWDPVRRERVLDRPILVETSAEILAKKLWYRAASLPARDLFDFAAVAALEPRALREIGGVLRVRRLALLDHLRSNHAGLREDFAALDAWQFNPRFEGSIAALRAALSPSALPPVLEQPRCPYVLPSRGRQALVAAGRECKQAGERIACAALPEVASEVAELFPG
jgi:hypothetical protein